MNNYIGNLDLVRAINRDMAYLTTLINEKIVDTDFTNLDREGLFYILNLIEQAETEVKNIKRKEEVESREPDTCIYDRQGWSHDGYLCGRYCAACPYMVEDCMGEAACYADQYKKCEMHD